MYSAAGAQCSRVFSKLALNLERRICIQPQALKIQKYSASSKLTLTLECRICTLPQAPKTPPPMVFLPSWFNLFAREEGAHKQGDTFSANSTFKLIDSGALHKHWKDKLSPEERQLYESRADAEVRELRKAMASARDV